MVTYWWTFTLDGQTHHY